MGELSEKFRKEYGIEAKELAETVLLDTPVKSIGMNKGLEIYFQKPDLKTEVNERFLREFTEALADSKIILPAFARIDFDETPTFDIPQVVGSMQNSKGLIYDFKDVVGNDDLRPSMTGVFVGEEGVVVGTDAHKLIRVKTTEFSEYAGKIINVKRYVESDGKRIEFIDEKYPNYEAIIPRQGEVIKKVDLLSLNNYLFGCIAITKVANLSNSATPINLQLGDVSLSLNLPIFHSIVKFFLRNGYTYANFQYEAANRAVVIKSYDEVVLGLVMPIMVENASEPFTRRMTFEQIYSKYNSPSFSNKKVKKEVIESRAEKSKKPMDISGLSKDEQDQAKELMEAIETFQFLLDSLLDGRKMATGGITQSFSSPQIMDGMYGTISTFAEGGRTYTREEQNAAFRQMLSKGGRTYAEAEENFNKNAGLPTKKDALMLLKAYPNLA